MRSSPLSMRKCRRRKRAARTVLQMECWSFHTPPAVERRHWRDLRRADIPAIKEPSELIPGSDLRLDGLTLISWQGGRCLAWDATVVDNLAMSYLSTSSTDVGSAAKAAAERKTAKYSALSSPHIFIPVAVETLGPINEAGDYSWPSSANSYHPSLMTPGRHSSSSTNLRHHSAV